ncbi:MAG TPA: hypothetical protein DCQ31_15150 [Bacteroidales bacterium]|nr:hypothetical protein [Bacteroidales bacterium]
MNTLFTFLTFLFFLMLIVGLIVPKWVLFWSNNKTRKKVLVYYGLATIVSFVLFAATSEKTQSAANLSEEAAGDETEIKYNYGSITYVTEASGSNEEGVKLFKAFAATEYVLKFAENLYYQEEYSGLNEGIVLMNEATKANYYLNRETGLAEKIGVQNVDKWDEATKQFAPQFYKYEAEATDEYLEICGHKARKYIVEEFAAKQKGATAVAWILDEYTFPPSRLVFENDAKRITAPVPVFFGNKKGIVLKLEINENNTIVTFTATKLSLVAPNYAEFEIPDNFSVKEEK